MQITNYFNIPQIHNVSDLEEAYSTLCEQYSSENDSTISKRIQAEYEVLAHLLEEGEEDRYQGLQAGENELDEELIIQYLKVYDLPLTIEIVGTWIWVSGDTRPHRETLKAAKFFWAHEKKMWYWRHSSRRGWKSGKSLEEIKQTHGVRTMGATFLS